MSPLNIIRTPDTVKLTDTQVQLAIAAYIEKQTGRLASKVEFHYNEGRAGKTVHATVELYDVTDKRELGEF